jgi:hypothetical protein
VTDCWLAGVTVVPSPETVTAGKAGNTTVVASLYVLFPLFASPLVVTVTVLVTVGYAVERTPTVRVMAAVAPAARDVVLVQVTFCPEAEQLQFAPAADT